jgi:ATP phosphoribosyltransferase
MTRRRAARRRPAGRKGGKHPAGEEAMPPILRLALPKGRITDEVLRLLAATGLTVKGDRRSYRPRVSDPEVEIKFLKPQNIPKLLEIGAHDCGFTGHDWVVESGADVVEILDTGLDPVTLVVAAPESTVDKLAGLGRPLIVAAEFENISKRYMESRKMPYVLIRTYGATEVYPPEDADLILDLISTGTTLSDNHLKVVEKVLESSTRFLAARAALEDRWKRERIESLRTLMSAVLEARRRILLEMNVASDRLDAVIGVLPAMKSPTVQELHGHRGYAVKAAVPRERLADLIMRLREAGATDLLAYALEKVIP